MLIVNFVSDAELGGLRTSMNLLGLITILLVLFENKITPKASRIYFNQGIFDLKNMFIVLQSQSNTICIYNNNSYIGCLFFLSVYIWKWV